MKVISYIKRPEGLSHETFARTLQHDLLPDLLRGRPGIRHCRLNLQSPALAGGLPGEKMGPENTTGQSLYSAVVEYQLEADAHELAACLKVLSRQEPFRADIYWAEPFVEKDEASDAPYLRLISPCYPLSGLTAPEVFQRWGEHVERALRIHAGMSAYVRNWHRAALTPDAPAFFGTPMLTFETRQDWEQRFYIDKAGEREIADDVSSFVGSFVPMLATVHDIR